MLLNMTKAANDNFDPWTSLGLATAMALNKLRCDAQIRELASEPNEADKKQRQPEKSDDGADKAHHEKESADLERRVRDILAMENRLRRKTI